MKRILILALAAMVWFSQVEAIHAAELTVFAAASLTDAMKETGAAYQKQSKDKIAFNFGASSMLARQIEEGAPADVFFSADEAKMDGLAAITAAKGLILRGDPEEPAFQFARNCDFG